MASSTEIQPSPSGGLFARVTRGKHSGKQPQPEPSCTFRALEIEHLFRDWPLGHSSDVSSDKWDTLEAKSIVTSYYDIFLSHAWEAGSFPKAVSLGLRYNSEGAVIIGILECCVLHQWCELPAHLALTISCITYLFCLRWGPVRGRVFLDRCCIPQDDPDKKANCLLIMPEYLASSRKLIAMWDEAYQSRLWCIFELAVFVKQHGIENIEVWTLQSIEFTAFFFFASYLFWVGHIAAEAHESVSMAVDFIFSSAHASYISFRFLPSVKRYLEHGIALKVKRLRCSLASDRDVLLTHIQHLHGSYRNFDEQVTPLVKALVFNLRGAPFALRLTMAAILPSTLAMIITGRLLTAILVGVFPNLICFTVVLMHSRYECVPFVSRDSIELYRVFMCVLAAVFGAISLCLTRTYESFCHDDLHLLLIPVQIAVSIVLISAITRLTFAPK